MRPLNKELFKEWLKSGHVTISTLLLQTYKQLGLSNENLVFLIQLKSFVDQGEGFPNINVIADRMKISRDDAFKEVHALINKDVLTINTKVDEEGKSKDEFSFDLLWEKVLLCLKQNNNEKMQMQTEIDSKELYQLFEKEFGRPLSPIEIQTLNMWIDEDHYKPELIQMALREAVLSQVYSLKYIDRILLNWEKKNIRSKDQVEKESKQYRNKKVQDSISTSQPSKPVPMYDWLKDFKD